VCLECVYSVSTVCLLGSAVCLECVYSVSIGVYSVSTVCLVDYFRTACIVRWFFNLLQTRED
jgi:hypothetical protein